MSARVGSMADTRSRLRRGRIFIGKAAAGRQHGRRPGPYSAFTSSSSARMPAISSANDGGGSSTRNMPWTIMSS